MNNLFGSELIEYIFQECKSKNLIINFSDLFARKYKINTNLLLDYIANGRHSFSTVLSPGFTQFDNLENRTFDIKLSPPYKKMGFFNNTSWERAQGF